MSAFKRLLYATWLHPRHIGRVYMQRAMRAAAPFARGCLLDVGCGLRPYAPLLAPHITRYVGVDWPPTPDKAQQDATADALRLPFAAATFDTVVSTEVMEHLPDPFAFLAEVTRVLRPGGRLILSVPLIGPLHEEPRDFYRFTPYSLRYLLERHGLQAQGLWSRGGWWSVVLGVHVSQGLYSLVNPLDASGRRAGAPLTVLALPFCAAAQLAGYALDKVFKAPQYTMGYVIAGELAAPPAYAAAVPQAAEAEAGSHA